jgi:outer membrane protein assembly factor BamE (lipoprotein component of BamABCDE complex)
MQKILAISAILWLTGCSNFIYSGDVEQGQDHLQAHASKLSLGMSKHEVSSIMGVPNVVEANAPNHWTYIHSLQHYQQPTHVSYISLAFKDDHLVSISPVHNS